MLEGLASDKVIARKGFGCKPPTKRARPISRAADQEALADEHNLDDTFDWVSALAEALHLDEPATKQASLIEADQETVAEMPMEE